MKLYHSYLLLFVFIFSCKAQKTVVSPDAYEGDLITFGSGGGFTGKTKSYKLLSNGQFFKSKGMDGEHDELVSLDSKVCNQIFYNYDQLKLAEIILDDPGNMYKFLSFRNKEGSHRIQWGGKNEEVPQKLKDFHRNLNQLANKNKAVLK